MKPIACIFTLISFLIQPVVVADSNGAITKNKLNIKTDLHVVSIAIGKYGDGIDTFGCINDSKLILELIKTHDTGLIGWDSIFYRKKHSEIKDKYHKIDTTYIHKLWNEQATKDNIIDLLNKLSQRSRPQDILVFHFSGLSRTFDSKEGNFESMLIPFLSDLHHPFKDSIPQSSLLQMSELAVLFNNISAREQLIIIDGGQGADLGEQLLATLYESNPLLAVGSDRQRAIITTQGMTIEYGGFGYLAFMLYKTQLPLTSIFCNSLNFEYSLNRTAVDLSFISHSTYNNMPLVYLEQDYLNFMRINLKHNTVTTRSLSISKRKETQDENSSQLYALLIATDKYDESSGWKKLKNPINDAEAVGNILKSKYGARLIKCYDQHQDSVLLKLAGLREVLDSNDQLVVFIAGHGYFNSSLSDGSIVFNDSKSIQVDPFGKSYLSMATLNRQLNSLPCQGVFTIFDVCFGATFDLLSRDIEMATYSGGLDVTPETLKQRKSQYKSRIFLASGRYEVPDYWSSSLDHSPFASRLLQSLQSAEAFISPGRCYSSMQGNATEPFLKEFGSHDVKSDFIMLEVE